ncbi:putative solute carrier organic anion transporter family member 4A1 [Apostichopus japonicus]|uniref:Solute carrier organic anion transporter family member n=1 Tax=Stichopus japonicus TaxID=307972 RepID=A0A2G8KTQ6_STIJA|nr:putative solute carrier organic anion transporter family member 4A1 [Apostichopus japonicus]
MEKVENGGLQNEGFQNDISEEKKKNDNHDNDLKTDEVKTNDVSLQERIGEYDDDVSKNSTSSDEDDENLRCGWFNLRPNWIQVFNRPAGFLFFIFLYSLAQSTTVNGLVYVVTTTLERRFNLPSTRSGSISSMYDFSVLIVIVFVTYFGERAHKPVWLGTGALIFGMGSFLFTLPHFLTHDYSYGSAEAAITCNASQVIRERCSDESNDEGNLSRYYYCFLAAQFLHGIGASPLYTLGQAYIYDNTAPKQGPVFLGIFQVASNFAPAIGFIGGGLLLQVYTDLKVRDEQTIDPGNPLWVGNWWLGFMCTGTVAIISAIPLLAFPKRLPGTQNIEKDRKLLSQSGSQFKPSGYGTIEKLRDFPRAIFNLLKNLPVLCNYLATASEFFLVACISVFGPKFVESQFSLTSAEAAMFAGLVVIPSALGGVLLGGWLIKFFDWQFKGRMRFVVGSLFTGWLMMLVLLASCPNIPFAGVTVAYGDQSDLLDIGESNVTSACNLNCTCGTEYDPVCGSNNVMYYTACHAGCSIVDDTIRKKEYADCNCVDIPGGTSEGGGEAIQGRCLQDCKYQTLFFVAIFGALLLTFAIVVPAVTGILSIVDESQRTLSLGLSSLFYRCLGTVPGPIIFGKLIDNSCMLWEDECEGLRTCWVYQNSEFARALFLVLFICRALSIIFFSGTLFFYKPVADHESEIKENLELDSKKIAAASVSEKEKEVVGRPRKE